MSEKRSPDTWMPLYVGDYLADTMHLSTAQHGAYLLLIFAYWRRGRPLPDDDVELSAICRLTLREWHKSFRLMLARFFEIGDGVWRHKRIEEEMAEATKAVQRGKAGGNASAKARERKRQQTVNENPTNDQQAPQQDANESPSPLPSQSPSPSEAKASGADAPNGAGDPVKALFDLGVSLLTSFKCPEKQARSLLGKWRKELGDDGKLTGILVTARQQSAIEPVGYITQAVQNELARQAAPHGRALL